MVNEERSGGLSLLVMRSHSCSIIADEEGSVARSRMVEPWTEMLLVSGGSTMQIRHPSHHHIKPTFDPSLWANGCCAEALPRTPTKRLRYPKTQQTPPRNHDPPDTSALFPPIVMLFAKDVLTGRSRELNPRCTVKSPSGMIQFCFSTSQ